MAKNQKVLVPDIGDFAEVEIVDVMISAGDQVAAEDSLITLETDKAAMDVPAPIPGKVIELKVALGDKVSEGSLILVLEANESESEETPAEPKLSKKTETKVELDKTTSVSSHPKVSKPVSISNGLMPAINEAGFSKAHASPSVRKFARELGVNLIQLKGSGSKDRITKDDVKAFVKAVMSGQLDSPGGNVLPELPQVDFTKFGTVEEKPLGRIQKISGPRLHSSWLNYPHVTQNDEADITAMEEARQSLKVKAAELGFKLTPLAFVIKALAQSLEEFPVFNTSMAPDGKNLIWKKYLHVGFAADTPSGLVVPVIRDADQKDIFQLAKELAEMSTRAREGKLKAEEMQGGCITVSSLGGIGGTSFTPIINPPEVAILGIPRAKIQPVWNGEAFIPRLIQPLCLTYDHRIIDGATGVRFTSYLANALSELKK
ncbi:MAG: 2-oxo acid dehydrogenase subunit E2 [Pseudomonadota bacterium]|nr:2-oxo acid dehydrogenase subunit E2 [Pseudomonadota bacterium]